MKKLKKLGRVGVYLTHSKGGKFFQNMKKDISQVPGAVKILIINMSLLRFGRGIGINMYYSIFLKTIFDNLLLVSILGSLLAFTKLFFSIPIGILDSKINSKNILKIGKILFAFSGILYFMAGYFKIPVLIVFAIMIHGLAVPMIFNTNQFLIRKLMPIHLSSKTFGMFFSTYQFGYLLAALLTAFLMQFDIPLPYFFLMASGVTIFTLFNNTTDDIIDKHGFFYEIKKEIIKKNSFKEVIKHLKKHKNGLGIMLFMQSLHGLLYYLGFMFIPLLAVSKDFSLVQVALLFAVMRIPHALTFYLESLFSEKKELLVSLITFFIVIVLLVLIAVSANFVTMLIISLIMSFLIATTRPMLAGMVTRLVKKGEHAEITGVQDFVNRGGEILGYLIFGVLAQFISLEIAFIGVAIGALALTLFAFKRRKKIKFYPVTED